MTMIDAILEIQPELQNIRRDLHAHPELSFEEHRTAERVAAKLTEWGIPMVRGLGVTGVVGIIKNGSSGRAIGLRADMDALPMQEFNQFSHASQNLGKMHACGHDGHTTMLLGAAHYLAKNRHFDGTVYLIFQPAEEGGGGAQRMIDDGLFERFPMEAVFGMHNFPGMAVGTFGVIHGPMMASASEFTVKIKGQGAHGAQPQLGVDPLMAALQIAQSWQSIVTRNKNPMDLAVLSITQFHSGSADNVIPDDAVLGGTVRTFSMDVLDLIETRMRDIAQHTVAAFGATLEFEFHRNYPVLVNSAAETDFCLKVMRSIVGDAHVDASREPTMGAEDFAFMLQKKPGCYVLIGNGGDGHREAGHGLGPCNLHNASYDFNDALLPLGATYWVRLVEAYLRHPATH